MVIDVFNSDGTWNNPGVDTVEVLVVGGGGGGGEEFSAGGGGGGGGGVIYDSSRSVSSTESVTVGEGGAVNSNGGDSGFAGITAYGGGAGGSADESGNTGGSGGGSGQNYTSGAGGSNPGTWSGSVDAAHASSGENGLGDSGGGGGGAGESGGTDELSYGGDGVYYGDVFSDSYGENGYFGGGGAGGDNEDGGSLETHDGGLGGGAENTGNNGDNGGYATGGGGAGDGANSSVAGSGGSGVVLIKYETPPSDPSNLSATSVSTNQIDLTWADNSSNEDSFDIYRATSSGSSKGDYSLIDSVGADNTSYSDTGLSEGTAYFYRVVATNSEGDSNISNEASATTALESPSGLSASSTSASEVYLSWTDNSSNEDGFYVYRSTSSESTKSDYTQIADLGTDTVSYSDTGLSSNTNYYYRVSAYSSSSESSLSGESSAKTENPLGTIKLHTDSGIKSLPVFDPDDLGSGVYSMLRVKTPSGVACIPLTDPENATYPQIRVKTESYGILAIHDKTSDVT